ncbi:MAG: class I SAM-dependent methyltransferase [Vicinamibacterales bacterium]
MTEYESYLSAEWRRYLAEPIRFVEAEQLMRAAPGTRVLDVGCGAGQELLPFVRADWTCFGVDLSAEAGDIGKTLFRTQTERRVPAFLRASAESLPFPRDSFDVVICRVALPYTHNRAALREICRVMRRDGLLKIKIHAAGYYLEKAWSGVRQGEGRSVIHAMRVLLNGFLFSLTGRQPRNRVLGTETYMSSGMLARMLLNGGIRIEREAPDSSERTPAFWGRKLA